MPMESGDFSFEEVGGDGDKFLGTEATGDAFAAGFAAKELEGIEGFFGHIAAFGVDDDAGAEGLGGAEGAEEIEFEFEVEEIEFGGLWGEAASGGEGEPLFIFGVIAGEAGGGGEFRGEEAA